MSICKYINRSVFTVSLKVKVLTPWFHSSRTEPELVGRSTKSLFFSFFSVHILVTVVLFLRMTKALTETDGPSWREKLPPIPTVPLSVKEKLAQNSAGNVTQQSPTPQQNGTTQTKKPGT